MHALILVTALIFCRTAAGQLQLPATAAIIDGPVLSNTSDAFVQAATAAQYAALQQYGAVQAAYEAPADADSVISQPNSGTATVEAAYVPPTISDSLRTQLFAQNIPRVYETVTGMVTLLFHSSSAELIPVRKPRPPIMCLVHNLVLLPATVDYCGGADHLQPPAAQLPVHMLQNCPSLLAGKDISRAYNFPRKQGIDDYRYVSGTGMSATNVSPGCPAPCRPVPPAVLSCHDPHF